MNDNNLINQIAGIFTRAAPTYDQVGFNQTKSSLSYKSPLFDMPQR